MFTAVSHPLSSTLVQAVIDERNQLRYRLRDAETKLLQLQRLRVIELSAERAQATKELISILIQDVTRYVHRTREGEVYQPECVGSSVASASAHFAVFLPLLRIQRLVENESREARSETRILSDRLEEVTRELEEIHVKHQQNLREVESRLLEKEVEATSLKRLVERLEQETHSVRLAGQETLERELQRQRRELTLAAVEEKVSLCRCQFVLPCGLGIHFDLVTFRKETALQDLEVRLLKQTDDALQAQESKLNAQYKEEMERQTQSALRRQQRELELRFR